MKVLITGGTGFIGSYFLQNDHSNVEWMSVNLRKQNPNEINFNEVQSVLHLAGMAHRMEQVDEQEYFKVNRDLTLELAKNAKASGVKHFIFMSTVKVFGDKSPTGGFKETHRPVPEDAYGASKFEAEKLLWELEDENFIVSVIRPALVYGPMVKGNLDRLLKLIDRGTTLPFKSIPNKRSMVSIQNLQALIHLLIQKPTQGVFHATDNHPISTSELVEWMAEGLEKKSKLIKFPGVFNWILKKMKPQLHVRLFGSYLIDSTEGYDRINFKPPSHPKDGIIAMAKFYKENTIQSNA